MGRKSMFPAFPQTRALPWVLGGLSLAALVIGLVNGSSGFEILGGAGLAAVVIAYPLAHLLMGEALQDDEPQEAAAAATSSEDDHSTR